jgi:hypothetical protein
MPLHQIGVNRRLGNRAAHLSDERRKGNSTTILSDHPEFAKQQTPNLKYKSGGINMS